LGGGTDTGDRETDVNSGTHTSEEEFGFQEDLAIGDGNDVGRTNGSLVLSSLEYERYSHIGGHITTLGLNDGEGSQRSTTEVVVQLGSTLKETRVEVEDITGVGLTTRRTTEKERHLTVSNGLLGKIVIDDQS